MTEHNQKLEPSRFDLNADSAAGKAATATGQTKIERSAADTATGGTDSHKLTLAGLAGLTLVAALVIFWLPDRVAPPEIETPAASATTYTKTTPVSTASPWSDAQLAQERKDAQAILSSLLEEQFALEETGVEQWAPEAFTAAQVSATEGDELYRQQQFVEASAAYQKGLEEMRAITASAPRLFEQNLQLGQQALEANQSAQAIAALEMAVLMQPDSTMALHALDRARNLEQVLKLLIAAQEARSEREFDDAIALLEQALALDREHTLAKSELAATRRDRSRRNFNRAMTAGYQAMDQQAYDKAEDYFLKAQRILPAAQETESALLEARTSRTRQRIDLLREQAEAAESNEEWPQAMKVYQAMLSIDDSVVIAHSGLVRSKTRANIDQRLERVISKPERLSDATIYAQTQRLQQVASGLRDPGPKLRQQLATISELLQMALTPVAVLLESNEQTDVTVYKVARLGTFRRHQLELKPGTYTAVGVRNGYRDVRRKFTIRHDSTNPVIEIACTDPI